MHPVLVVMSTTFDYFVYFSIPYRLNRIKKSQKEIEIEAIQKKKELDKKKKKKKKSKKKKNQTGEDDLSPVDINPKRKMSKNEVDKISECSHEDSDDSSQDGGNFSIQTRKKKNSILSNEELINPDF